MTLSTLLDRAGVSNWNRGTWFRGAELRGSLLFVPDPDDATFIDRTWGATFREHMADLEIRVLLPAPGKPRSPSYLNAKGRAWHAQQTRLPNA